MAAGRLRGMAPIAQGGCLSKVDLMLKNISIRGARTTPAVGLLLLVAAAVVTLSACGKSAAPASDVSKKTQIVVQWVDGPNALSTWQVFRLQGVFDDRADQGGYFSDGNDVGSGTQNFYLYADDNRVDSVVQFVIAMERDKQVPDGMRIGVAVYKDAKRKDWAYRAVYPSTLTHFNIMYRGKS